MSPSLRSAKEERQPHCLCLKPKDLLTLSNLTPSPGVNVKPIDGES